MSNATEERPVGKARQDPSPAEIESECMRIRAGWSDEERLKRLRCDLRPYFTLADGRSQEFSVAAYEIHHAERPELQEAD